MSIVTNIEVENATYLDGYKISILFTDGKNQIVDFSDFLIHTKKELLSKYKLLSNFKNFKVEDGNLVWGRNWDLIFPVHQLYEGTLKS